MVLKKKCPYKHPLSGKKHLFIYMSHEEKVEHGVSYVKKPLWKCQYCDKIVLST